jgi:hypothetical protein
MKIFNMRRFIYGKVIPKTGRVLGMALVIVCSLLIFFACRPPPAEMEESGDSEEVRDEETQQDAAFEEPDGWSGSVGVLVAPTTYLYKLNAEGLMEPANKIRYAGDIVGWKGEELRTKHKSNNNERLFFRIDSDGEDLWAQEYSIAGPNTVPGVVLGDNTMLYARPDLAAPVSTVPLSLPQYTIVAVFTDMENDQFMGVKTYLESINRTVDRLYVKRQNITLGADDVKSIQLYQLALATTIGPRRKELLTNALEISGSFGSLIERALEDLEESSEFRGTFSVKEDNVNIRSRPSTEGEKIGSLNKGALVSVFGRTNVRWQAAGKTDFWYLTDDGWVFGAFLEKYEPREGADPSED